MIPPLWKHEMYSFEAMINYQILFTSNIQLPVENKTEYELLYPSSNN